MTTIKPYIPIVRWRPAERKALEKLFPQDRENVTPLIEFVMPAPSTKRQDDKVIVTKTSREKFSETLSSVGTDILESCGHGAAFVDVHLLESEIRASSLEQILSSSTSLNLFSVPVTYIIPVTSTSADMTTRAVAVNYAKSTGHGLCIRIDRSHLDERDIAVHITDFLSSNGLNVENTDLLVDLGVVTLDTNASEIVKRLAQLPELNKWRSFILSGGVFPKDLTEYTPGRVYELDRRDWKLWNAVRKDSLQRTPLFSDYTVQCPEYERIDAIGSASIRYTDDDKWWIFRGTKPGHVNKNGEKGPGREQYIDHARTLTGRNFSQFYKGGGYSFGDSEITRIATPNNQKPGSPGTWLTVGINHHITLVARQTRSDAGSEAYS